MEPVEQEGKRISLKANKYAHVQDQLLLSAVALFAERGSRAVSIEEIAANVGATKSLIYHYFTSKNEILYEIFSRNWQVFFNTLNEVLALGLPPEETLRRMIVGHALNVMGRPQWAAIYHRDESELTPAQQKLMQKQKREYGARFEKVYTQGVAQGVFKDIPPKVAINGILGMCNWLYKWYRPNGPLDAHAIADHFVSILMSGLSADRA